jgi:UDP-glucose 4-epimerase
VQTNILGTLNVLDSCHHYRVPLVNICVGNWWHRNSYSTSKHCAERLVEQYRDELDLPAANVRVVNAYGPGQSVAAPFGPGRVRKVTPSFICRALAGMPIEIYGDGRQISDMVHVRDVAATLVATVETLAIGKVPDRVLECGPATHTTVNDVAQMVAYEAAQITGQPVETVHLPMRPGEAPGKVTCDWSTLVDVGVDTATFTSLPDGIRETVAWYAANEGTAWRRA